MIFNQNRTTRVKSISPVIISSKNNNMKRKSVRPVTTTTILTSNTTDDRSRCPNIDISQSRCSLSSNESCHHRNLISSFASSNDQITNPNPSGIPSMLVNHNPKGDDIGFEKRRRSLQNQVYNMYNFDEKNSPKSKMSLPMERRCSYNTSVGQEIGNKSKNKNFLLETTFTNNYYCKLSNLTNLAHQVKRKQNIVGVVNNQSHSQPTSSSLSLLPNGKARNNSIVSTSGTCRTNQKRQLGVVNYSKKLTPVFPKVKIRISPEFEKEDAITTSSIQQQQLLEFKRLMDTFIHAATTSCSCAENLRMIENDPEVEVSWEDLARRCTDFGISDYLSAATGFDSTGDDNELTENLTQKLQYLDEESNNSHWLCASPPLRLSDTDFDSIEPLPVTLETLLNFEPETNNNGSYPPIGLDHIETDVFLEEIPNEICNHGLHNCTLTSSSDPEPTDEKIKIENFEVPLLFRDLSDKIKKIGNFTKPFRRQISLPSKLFGDFYFKTSPNREVKYDWMSVNCRLNKQESLSESFKTPHLLNQIQNFSITSNNTDCMGSNLSIGSYKRSGRNFQRCCSTNFSWSETFSHSDLCDVDDLSNTSSIDYVNSDDPAFVSELEKRAILLRNMRRLFVRQDTIQNFAPSDFCI